MANNVKPDDLAILINDDVPENIGAVVLVVEQERSPLPGEEALVMWICTTEGRPLMCHDIEGGVRTGTFSLCTEFAVFDRDLRPVSGLPLEDLVETSLVA